MRHIPQYGISLDDAAEQARLIIFETFLRYLLNCFCDSYEISMNFSDEGIYIRQVFKRVKEQEFPHIGVSFNGGKDSVVMLHLICETLENMWTVGMKWWKTGNDDILLETDSGKHKISSYSTISSSSSDEEITDNDPLSDRSHFLQQFVSPSSWIKNKDSPETESISEQSASHNSLYHPTKATKGLLRAFFKYLISYNISFSCDDKQNPYNNVRGVNKPQQEENENSEMNSPQDRNPALPLFLSDLDPLSSLQPEMSNTANNVEVTSEQAIIVVDFIKSHLLVFYLDDPDEVPEIVEFRRQFVENILLTKEEILSESCNSNPPINVTVDLPKQPINKGVINSSGVNTSDVPSQHITAPRLKIIVVKSSDSLIEATTTKTNTCLTEDNNDDSTEPSSLSESLSSNHQKRKEKAKPAIQIMKKSLETLKRHYRMYHIFLGIRCEDTDAKWLSSPVTPCSKGWPLLCRVCPIFYWSYQHVWSFTFSRYLPFCSLYAEGFTSIGGVKSSYPNKYLKVYIPRCYLLNGERDIENSKNSCINAVVDNSSNSNNNNSVGNLRKSCCDGNPTYKEEVLFSHIFGNTKGSLVSNGLANNNSDDDGSYCFHTSNNPLEHWRRWWCGMNQSPPETHDTSPSSDWKPLNWRQYPPKDAFSVHDPDNSFFLAWLRKMEAYKDKCQQPTDNMEDWDVNKDANEDDGNSTDGVFYFLPGWCLLDGSLERTGRGVEEHTG